MNVDASVVISTYHRVDRLVAGLEGVRAQTHPAKEVVVIVHASDDASAELVGRLAADWPALRGIRIERRGTVAAYNLGLASVHGAIVCYLDDDAVPAADWLERIVATFALDDRIAAVGGRDIVVEDGRIIEDGATPTRRGDEPTVGRVQWFGRMIGNHHVGIGAARDVDLLKGVNMSFRRDAIAALGFDERLRGRGAQMHAEVSICLPLKRRGLRLVYDPAISVMHYTAPRLGGEKRGNADFASVAVSAHNEALELLDYFNPVQRVVYAGWGFAFGGTEAPGLAVLLRESFGGGSTAWSRFVAAQSGRAAAWKTRRTPRQPPRSLEAAMTVPGPSTHQSGDHAPGRGVTLSPDMDAQAR